MATDCPRAECVRTLHLDGCAANEISPADVNGDGELELLCLQSPGIYQSRLFNDGAVFWDAPYDASGRTRRADCGLAAVDLRGNVLWRYGEPKPYVDAVECFTHVPDQQVWCEDIDEDGSAEVLLIHRDRLLLLDGRTGTTRRETTLNHDSYGIVRTYRGPGGRRVLVSNTERGYPPHWYGDPTLLFDADLKPLATLTGIVGAGHSPRALDIDGDGVDELLLGYEAYDADGHRLWRLDGLDPSGYDPDEEHVDQLQVAPLGEQGEPRIVYAGSRMAYAADLHGHVVWARELGHPQHVAPGRFVPAPAPLRVAFLANIRTNVVLFVRGPDGRLDNAVMPPVAWPEAPAARNKAHSGEGFLIYPQGCADGTDALIARDWGWPSAWTIHGEQAFEIPCPDFTAQGRAGTSPRTAAQDEQLRRDHMWPHAPVVPRESYGVRIADFDGDGRAEILVHNLRTAWIFKPPFPAPGAPTTHDRLQPVTGQGWYALEAGGLPAPRR